MAQNFNPLFSCSMQKKCALCGGDSFQTIEKLPAHLVVCKACGLVFIQDSTPLQIHQDLYRKRYGFDVRTSQSSKFLDRKNYSLARWITGNLKINRQEKRLLEIGCSAGYLLKMLNQPGFQLYGLEPCEEAVQFARKNNQLENIENGFFEEAVYPEEFFDSVILIQTFEHVIYPAEFLSKIRNLLKSDGKLFIEVPDALALEGVYRWELYPSANHLYVYSSKTLTALLKKCGFKAVNLKRTGGNIRIVAKKSAINEPEPQICKASYHKFLLINRINKELLRIKKVLRR